MLLALSLTGMSPHVVSALISGVVALLVSVVGPSLKHGFDKRFLRRKLELEYRYEQQKNLRDHIARFKGLFLETGGSLSGRMWNFYKNESQGWLAFDSRDLPRGYYVNSFAYRILITVAACRLIERQALFFDTTVAAKKDRKFLEAMKLNIATWTEIELFDGLGYASDATIDHMYRDDLAAMADSLHQDEALTPFQKFRDDVAGGNRDCVKVFEFLNGMCKGESRFRFDRVVAAHLVLLATLNRFGYEYQKKGREEFLDVARRCNHPATLANLGKSVRAMKLHRESGFRDLVWAIERAT
ncbi:hypothetical protein [Streptomyces sp. NPDC047108]|uniref:hypothetical protein n=1 Tax=Streptomyces sp. NPDC047108 TaxID=3155025 RepID=UPI0033EAD1F4